MKVSSRVQKRPGKAISPRASRQNTGPLIHFGPPCQTWEQGSLLKRRALELMSASLDTLIISPSEAPVLSRALWKSKMWGLYCGIHTNSIATPFSVSEEAKYCCLLSMDLCPSSHKLWRPSMQILRGQVDLFLSFTCIFWGEEYVIFSSPGEI